MILFSDFDQDGVADNISFMIKRIKVHTSDALKDPHYRFPGNYGVEKFLELFSGNFKDFQLFKILPNGVSDLATFLSFSNEIVGFANISSFIRRDQTNDISVVSYLSKQLDHLSMYFLKIFKSKINNSFW